MFFTDQRRAQYHNIMLQSMWLEITLQNLKKYQKNFKVPKVDRLKNKLSTITWTWNFK